MWFLIGIPLFYKLVKYWKGYVFGLSGNLILEENKWEDNIWHVSVLFNSKYNIKERSYAMNLIVLGLIRCFLKIRICNNHLPS